MTRDEMATAVDDQARMARYDGAELVAAELDTVVVELKKRCDGCRFFFERHFNHRVSEAVCDSMNAFIPKDGSGHCYRWEAKS